MDIALKRVVAQRVREQDLALELIELQPKTSTSLVLPFEQETILLPIGDIQYGNVGCDLDRLKRHIDQWNDKPNVYYIGMGDYVDAMSPSNRRKWLSVVGDMYDSTKDALDDGINGFLEKVQEVLRPTIGKWVGLVTGHHSHQFQDGTTTDTRLANFLKTSYLGHSTLAHLVFKTKDKKRKAICKVWAHHGQGMGVTLEAAIRKVRSSVVPYWMANLYLIGHYHQVLTAAIPWIDTHVDGKGDIQWRSTKRRIVATGSFLEGFKSGSKDPLGHATGLYPEERMLPPNSLGAPVIFIRPKHSKDNYATIDLEVLT